MSDSLDRINAAIDECLERIERLKGKAEPRVELQTYLLEKQGKLPIEELRTVESMVFRIIHEREQRRDK
jgi:hypothetical protein